MRHAVANPLPSFLAGARRNENIPHAASRAFVLALGLALRLRLRRCGRVYELEPNPRDPPIPRAREARLILGNLKSGSKRWAAVWIYQATERAVCSQSAALTPMYHRHEPAYDHKHEQYGCNFRCLKMHLATPRFSWKRQLSMPHILREKGT